MSAKPSFVSPPEPDPQTADPPVQTSMSRLTWIGLAWALIIELAIGAVAFLIWKFCF